jgi:Signal transduction histidine kinase
MNLKKEIQHKLGDQSLTSNNPPTPILSNSLLHKTVHAAGHDLRSPLFVIRSYSQLLQKTQEKKLLENGFQLMGEATVKMEKTINELVGLIDIYTLPFPPKKIVSFEIAIESAKSELAKLINEHQPKLSHDFNDFPTVSFNEKYLASILLFLIDNAIRHNVGKENLKINISSKKIGKDLILIVQDNGRGIKEDPERVKNAFYSYTSNEDPECIGMGLAKVKAIAQVSQNSFFLESKPGLTKVSFVFKGR